MDLAKTLDNAIGEHKQGNFDTAKTLYLKVLENEPEHPDANHLLGLIELEMDNHNEAKNRLEYAVKLKPDQAEFYNSLGHFYLATHNTESELNRAIEFFEKSRNLNPTLESSIYNLAQASEKKSDFTEAINLYKIIIENNPNHIDALNNLGALHAKLKDFKKAKHYFELVLYINKDNKYAHNNIGNLYFEFGKYKEALVKFTEALSIDNDFLTAKVNIANTMLSQKQYPASANKFYECLNESDIKWQQEPNWIYLKQKCIIGFSLCMVKMCNFEAITNIRNLLISCIEGNINSNLPAVIDPQQSLMLDLPMDLHNRVLAKYTNNYNLMINSITPSTFPITITQNKIKIGYISPDFGVHSVGIFIADLVSNHNFDEFEIYLFSLIEHNDIITNKLKCTECEYIDCSEFSDQEVIEIITNIKLDILVDLAGFTKNTRLGIISHHPASIQMTYLGYPSSTHLKSIDYFIADKNHVPEEIKSDFTEKLLRIPSPVSICLNSPSFNYKGAKCTKGDYNLPKGKHILASFSQPYRINYETFSLWCKILIKIPNTVLWLLKDNAEVEHNLKIFADSHQIDITRIIFKEQSMINADWHIAHADLILDTLNESCLTTPLFGLITDTPAITLNGSHAHRKVLSGVLHALDLSELIAKDESQYIEIVTKYFNNKKFKNTIQEKLKLAKTESIVFKPKDFIFQLESEFRKAINI